MSGVVRAGLEDKSSFEQAAIIRAAVEMQIIVLDHCGTIQNGGSSSVRGEKRRTSRSSRAARREFSSLRPLGKSFANYVSPENCFLNFASAL